MSFLFSQPIPSYAQEQLSTQLSALSTLPLTSSTSSISFAGSNSAATSSLRQSGTASPYHDDRDLDPAYVEALNALSASDVKKEDLVKVLKMLSEQVSANVAGASRADAAVREEVLGRATTMAWKEVMEVLIRAALELEEERGWWESSVNSRRGVGIYLIQCECSYYLSKMYCRWVAYCCRGIPGLGCKDQSVARHEAGT
jgi:nuclear-control-of-ATPase protein 2